MAVTAALRRSGNAGRPARQIQWSAGIQRELFRNTLVEGAYVANRGAWWLSSIADNYNAISQDTLTANGLNINNAADRAILRAQIQSTAGLRDFRPRRRTLGTTGHPT